MSPQPPTSTSAPPRRRRWVRVLLWVSLVLVVALVVVRLALPSTLTWYVNRTLDSDPVYQGSIDRVSLSLWRGAYAVHGIRFDKATGNLPAPLFTADRLDLALQWDALLHGKVVGEVVVTHPTVTFVHGPSPAESQTGAGGPWLGLLGDLFPFDLNRFELRDGEVQFRSEVGSTPVVVYLSELQLTISNLTNVSDAVTPLVTEVHATALALDHAPVELQLKLDPFSYYPSFELALRLLDLDVTRLNGLSTTYGGFDFAGGYFDLVVQAQAVEGLAEGSVKPLFRHLEIHSFEQDLGKNPLAFTWELLLGITGRVFENPDRDQVGTLVTFSGDLREPSINLLETLGNLLRNAFIQAYLPNLRQTGSEVGMRFAPAEVVE